MILLCGMCVQGLKPCWNRMSSKVLAVGHKCNELIKNMVLGCFLTPNGNRSAMFVSGSM
jgi:hypothetical protein